MIRRELKQFVVFIGKIVAPIFCAAALISGFSQAGTVRAAPADSFVDFLGIQVQLHREGSPWETQASVWRSRLGELGIRYARTEIRTSVLARNHAAVLFTNFGIRLDVLIHPKRLDGSLNSALIPTYLNFIRDQVGVGKVLSVEGPNEYSSRKYAGQTDWASELRNFQHSLYAYVKADGILRRLPVLAPTIWRRIQSDYYELGNLGTSADKGNLHYYNGGRKPTTYLLERFRGDPGIVSPMTKAIQNAQITTPQKPIFVTETGYNVREDLPFSQFHVPERTAAKYALRLVSEFFLRRASVQKAFIYSLIDASSERQYGLLRRDLSRRLSFFAIKNAIKILSNPGAGFSPTTLTYSLSGNLTGIHQVVLQKRDGRFYLMIWNDAVSWDRDNLVELNPPARLITLDISVQQFRTLKLYLPTAIGLLDPNGGALPFRIIDSPRSVVLSVPDHVLIAEMMP